jgi:hypothetical protein
MIRIYRLHSARDHECLTAQFAPQDIRSIEETKFVGKLDKSIIKV